VKNSTLCVNKAVSSCRDSRVWHFYRSSAQACGFLLALGADRLRLWVGCSRFFERVERLGGKANPATDSTAADARALCARRSLTH
jgi:hypothetical protein